MKIAKVPLAVWMMWRESETTTIITQNIWLALMAQCQFSD